MKGMSIRSALMVTAQVGLTAWLMYLALRNIHYSDVVNSFHAVTGKVMVLCVTLGALQILLLVERWRIVLSCLDLEAPRHPLLQGILLERLFAQLLPVAIGGDAARAAYFIGRKYDATIAILSIIYDRVSGILGLILLAGLCALLFKEFRLPAALAITPVLLLLAMFAGMSITARIPRTWIEAVFGIIPGLRLKAFAVAGHDLLRDHRYSVWAMLLSALVQLLSCLMMAAIAHDVAPQLSEIRIALAAPIIFLAMTLPLTIAGWGVREQTAIFVFANAGASASSAVGISMLFGFLQLFLGIASALAFLAVSLTWARIGATDPTGQGANP